MSSPRLYAIAPTIFTGSGAVDAAAVAANVARIKQCGIRGVLLTGSYGEFQVLTAEERVEVTRAVTTRTPDVVVMSGAAAINTATATAVGAALYDAGADQVMVSAPFAAELTEGDLEGHFDRVAAALGRDLVVYNNPVFGVDLSVGLLERITRNAAYTAVKQGTRSLAAMVDSVAYVQQAGNAAVYAAADLACAAAVGAGAAGITSTNVWVFPEVFLALADPAVAPAEKARLRAAIRPYAEVVSTLGQPRTVKAAMELRGYAGGAEVRDPYTPLGALERKQLAEALAESDDLLGAVGGQR